MALLVQVRVALQRQLLQVKARQQSAFSSFAAESLKFTSRDKEMDIIGNLNKKKGQCASLLVNDNSESDGRKRRRCVKKKHVAVN